MIKFGVIGTGWITEAFIEASREVEGLKFEAVYSRTIEKAKEFALKNNAIYTFNSIIDMAKSDKIEAVYIASPNVLHFEQSKLFLQNKKHVICEKPITSSKEQAMELVSIAKENDVIFMEAIMSIHTPQLKILEQSLKRIGRISIARLNFSQLSSKYPKLISGELPNIFNIDMKTGCIMDIGVYCLYIALHLFPEYKSITSNAVKLPSTLDLCGCSTIEYDDMIVLLTYSKIADTAISSEIQGDEGTIIIDKISTLNSIKLRHNDGTIEQIFSADDKVKTMQYEAESFYNFITDLSSHKEDYEYVSNLCIKVSGVLQEIRHKSGVEF